VSKRNGHGRDAFSWDEDYDGWFEQHKAAATNADADATAAAPLWQQQDWDDLLVAPTSRAGSPQFYAASGDSAAVAAAVAKSTQPNPSTSCSGLGSKSTR
jgi:hypothetical protein